MSDIPNYWRSEEEAEKYTHYKFNVCDCRMAWILDYYQEVHPEWNRKVDKIPLIVDIGCGSGQMSVPLSDYCDKLLGIDISSDQIETARRLNVRPNIEYMVGTAEKLSEHCPKHGVDMIVSDMAAQYFSDDEFYSEVKKCLKPNGVIAMVGHWHEGIQHEDPYFQSFIGRFLIENSRTQALRKIAIPLSESFRTLYCPIENKTYRQETIFCEMSREDIREMFHGIDYLFKDGTVDKMVDSLPELDKYRVMRCVYGLFCHL